MIVTHADMLACRFCNRGSRAFCLRHGLNWQTFVQQGIDDSELSHIDDAMLNEVIAYARKRQEVNNG